MGGVSGTHTMNVKPWRMKLKIFRSILCSACTGILTHTHTHRTRPTLVCVCVGVLRYDFRFSGRVNYLHAHAGRE